ncbi:hypothetical protein B9Z19DRAFT_928003, partial [Tuber borchii]
GDPLPDPSQVSIEGITYAGTGCKAGSVAISHASDYQTLTLSFDSYVASIGPGVPFAEKRKNCNLNVNIHYPPGYQYTLYKIDYTGFADLQTGVSASQTSNCWFAGRFTPWYFQTSFTGPYTKTYTFTDTLASESLVWSPCGASHTLNCNTQLLLNSTNPGSSGIITTDVVDIQAKPKQVYGIRWRMCTE